VISTGMVARNDVNIGSVFLFYREAHGSLTTFCRKGLGGINGREEGAKGRITQNSSSHGNTLLEDSHIGWDIPSIDKLRLGNVPLEGLDASRGT